MAGGRKILIPELKDAILRQLNIAAYYEPYLLKNEKFVQDSGDGWSNRVSCPLHGGGLVTGCFFINLKTGQYKCQSCGKGGSVFDFWMEKHGFALTDKKAFYDGILAVARAANFNIDLYREGAAQTGVSSGNSSTPPPPKKAEPVVNRADENDRVVTPIKEEVVKGFQRDLESEQVQYLAIKRGLTKATIEKWRIGWDKKSAVLTPEEKWLNGRFVFPVPDRKGFIRNLRLYSNKAKPEGKVWNYVTDKGKVTEKGYGKPARLLGLHLLKPEHEHIVLCEGELDMFLLNQKFEEEGLQTWFAMTGTGGVNTFFPEWVDDLLGRHVYFCFDCDEPGKAAAPNIINRHFLRLHNEGKFQGIKIVTLPLEGTRESKDITDFFMKSQKTIHDFLRLCVDETPQMIVGGLDHDDASMEPMVVSDFVLAIKDRRYIDQRITVPITISGATAKVYHAIRSYRVIKCPLMKQAGQCCQEKGEEQTLPYGHSLFIEACMEREGSLLRSLAAMACDQEQQCRVRAVKKVVMEEYFAHQLVERFRIEEDAQGKRQNTQELVQTSVYILQPPDNMPIEPQNYQATGWIRTHPKTSVATFFVETMVPLEDDWKKFTVETPENRRLLEILKQDFTIDTIIKDIVHGVTRIYQADEILYAVLLSYLSPLKFVFNGASQRGWINTAIIGDSGMGKSKTYERLADWLELGDVFSAQTGTRTGLLYSIKKKGEEWFVSIGRYVQCHRKILAVDETQKMPPEEIGRMAIAMDTGYLEVQQVASGGYNCMTRTIFLMNPKDKFGRMTTMTDFPYGCESLSTCFEAMFIRRLDLAVFVTGKQKYEFYNKPVENSKELLEMRLTPKMMKTLVHWAWTRKMSQIHWTMEGTKTCLELTTELAKVFGDDEQIPLVNPQDFREKLARLSVSYAILDRNFTPDFEGIIVEPRHVQAVAKLVHTIYSSSACNLHQRSIQSRQKNTLEDFTKIKTAFEEAIQQGKTGTIYAQAANPFGQLLLMVQQVGSIRQNELSDAIGMSRQWTQRRLAILQGFNLIEATRHGYKVTRKFNLFMRDWRADEKINTMLASVHENLGKYALQQADTNEYEADTYVPQSHRPVENPFG